MAVAITRTADPAGVAGSGNATTYTSAATGTASDDRVTAVTISKEVATLAPSSVTLAGDLMRLASGNTFGSMGAWIYWLGNPSGTTATVVVNWGGNPLSTENHISVYAITDAAFPPKTVGNNTSTDMDATAPLTTGSITIPTNGGFLAVAAGATVLGKTWANATEDLDVSAGGYEHTTAIRVTALTTTAVTCTGGTNGEDGVLAYMILEQAKMPTDILVMPPLVHSR